MTSDRTKSIRKKRNLFGILSFVLWVGTALFLAIYAFCTVGNAEAAKEGTEIFTKEFKNILIGLGTTVLVALVGVIIIKGKIRTFVWMVSLILAVVLFKDAGMYVVLFIWLIDEYIFTNLFHHYCHLLQINKEIDLRT